MAITILPISAGGYTSELLDSTTATFKASDDVWCEGFLDGTLLAPSLHEELQLTRGLTAILSTTVLLPRGADYAVVSSPSASRLRSRASTPTAVGSALPKGPYFGVFEPSTLTLEVFEAFRLYPDDAQVSQFCLAGMRTQLIIVPGVPLWCCPNYDWVLYDSECQPHRP